MKNILLLTDQTTKSQNAHAYAFSLFEDQECTFHLLSIQKIWQFTMDDLMAAGAKSDLDTAILGDERLEVTKLVSLYRIRFNNTKFSFQAHIDYDVFTVAINKAVRGYGIDCIVCGTDGASDIVERLFSSHTLRIIRKVDCPVLIVPKGYQFQKPRQVQYLLDTEDIFEMCGKKLMLEIVRTFKSQIAVFRITTIQEVERNSFIQEKVEISKFFPSNGLTYHTISDSDIIETLNYIRLQYPGQLKVLSGKRETFLERIFSKSHVSTIVNMAKMPLLILRDCNS